MFWSQPYRLYPAQVQHFAGSLQARGGGIRTHIAILPRQSAQASWDPYNYLMATASAADPTPRHFRVPQGLGSFLGGFGLGSLG